MKNQHFPSVCIIGAGCSGITTAKAFHELGIPFDCFEKSDRVGGNWVFGNKNGMSAAYRRLFINTSKKRMQYSDFPMPENYPDFPHHSQIAEYFNQYVDHFGFRHHITFNTGVAKADLWENGVWEVTLETGEKRCYDAVIVANGHHWNPSWPDPAFPGTFNGIQMHSHSYVDNKIFEGKNVVVLGMGNSAMDIVVEASEVANRVFLSARRGAHIVPKYLFGKPIDQQGNATYIPLKLRRWALEKVLQLVIGKMENYGLPAPDHRLGDAHPTISSRVLDRITHGLVTPKPNIAELEGDFVQFTDGSRERVDVVVYCTGYKVTFPFFDEKLISAPQNDLPLFRRVFKPDIKNVFFVGLLQPLGAIMPLAEAQAKWVGDYLMGNYVLPSPEAMLADMTQEREKMFKRYVASKRHTMQVDFDEYLLDLKRELKRGVERAKKSGNALPIEPKAHLQPSKRELVVTK